MMPKKANPVEGQINDGAASKEVHENGLFHQHTGDQYCRGCSWAFDQELHRRLPSFRESRRRDRCVQRCKLEPEWPNFGICIIHDLSFLRREYRISSRPCSILRGSWHFYVSCLS